MGPIGIGIAIAIGCRIVEKPISDTDPDTDVLRLRHRRAKKFLAAFSRSSSA